MVGWPKKHFAECPRCGSANVDVPWSLPRERERHFWGRVLLGFLIATPLSAEGALLARLPLLWAAAGVCLGLAALLAIGYRRSLTIYVCLDCRKRWALGR